MVFVYTSGWGAWKGVRLKLIIRGGTLRARSLRSGHCRIIFNGAGLRGEAGKFERGCARARWLVECLWEFTGVTLVSVKCLPR